MYPPPPLSTWGIIPALQLMLLLLNKGREGFLAPGSSQLLLETAPGTVKRGSATAKHVLFPFLSLRPAVQGAVCTVWPNCNSPEHKVIGLEQTLLSENSIPYQHPSGACLERQKQ